MGSGLLIVMFLGLLLLGMVRGGFLLLRGVSSVVFVGLVVGSFLIVGVVW